VLFHQDNAPCHKSIQTTAKLYELGYELLPHSTIFSRYGPSDFILFADLKKMLAGNKFSTNAEVITETKAYFEAEEKSYYKNGIEKFYDLMIA
jgi:hypothetical protein